jgi:hypothetical protein
METGLNDIKKIERMKEEDNTKAWSMLMARMEALVEC